MNTQAKAISKHDDRRKSEEKSIKKLAERVDKAKVVTQKKRYDTRKEHGVG
jgi:hypothetical protein